MFIRFLSVSFRLGDGQSYRSTYEEEPDLHDELSDALQS